MAACCGNSEEPAVVEPVAVKTSAVHDTKRAGGVSATVGFVDNDAAGEEFVVIPRVAPAPTVTVIEGNIASGKSTETKHILDRSPETTEAQFEIVPSALLDRMYHGHDAYAFQLFMMTHRMLHFDLALRLPASSRLVLDRSMIGDVVFMNVQRIQGNISDDQAEAYAKTVLRDMSLVDKLHRVTQMFYLHLPAEKCVERCATRGRHEEADVKLAYFRLVQSVYLDALVWWTLTVTETPAVIVDGSSLGPGGLESSKHLQSVVRVAVSTPAMADPPFGIESADAVYPSVEALKDITRWGSLRPRESLESDAVVWRRWLSGQPARIFFGR